MHIASETLSRKPIWLYTMYFQNKNPNNYIPFLYSPLQQIVIKSQCKKSPRKREKEMLFCTIDKENLCEPRTKLTTIIQHGFYLSGERD